MVKNLPANAGDTGLIPGVGRSHMLLGKKPVHHNHEARVPRARDPPQEKSGAHALQLQNSPLAAARESVHAEMKAQHSHKLIN